MRQVYKMNIVIATIKPWNIEYANQFKRKYADRYQIHIITDRKDLTYNVLEKIQPQYVFFPHWSWIIPEKIHQDFDCIVFHMTDLPFGRGGSPLQNLIARGLENTKLSALKVDSGMDTGDIYLKEDLNLNGTAEEIFIRAANLIFTKMIPTILETQPTAKKQTGTVTNFTRRKPEESQLHSDMELTQLYDQIRMLDADGYPKAFIEFGKYKLVLSRASLKHGKVIADVEIVEGGHDE